MTLTPAKAAKIADMLQSGVGLDRISEEGVVMGWTRDEAKSVVTANGWALDWSGRLQGRYLSASLQPVAEQDAERLLAVGTDHELVEIRRLAVKAERALNDLRRALILQEELDAEEVARRRQEKQLADAERADPTRWDHGSWGAYLLHKRHKVPMCPACDAAGDEYRESIRTRDMTSRRHRQPALAS